MSPRVLHVIPSLSGGGGGRVTLFAAAAIQDRLGGEHAIASLRPAGTGMAAAARAEGMTVLDRPDAASLHAAMDAADVVHLHFWSSPELHELLERDLPPLRLLVWSHVAGRRAPQVLLPELCERAHALVVETPLMAELPAVKATHPSPYLIPCTGGWRAATALPPRRAGFVAGYVGTVGWAKLHPEYVDMSVAARIPGARFLVCGGGDAVKPVSARARELGAGHRFDVRGPVSDVRGALAEMDVFGYPLCEASYATLDLALKEAMLCGIPPVVLAHDPNASGIDHGRTGLIARDPEHYARLLERLHADPGERRRLGAAARDHAAVAFSPERVAGLWERVYRDVLAQPKRAVEPMPAPRETRHPGAERFVRSLGHDAGPFAASLRSADDGGVGACSPATATTDGGLLDYRRRYPGDALLALWTGLHFAAQGRPALAAGQLADARRLGIEPERVEPALERVAA